jgi:hypothetical protein
MKNGVATYGSISHEYYVLKINGQTNWTLRRFQDALKAGLLLRYQFPHDDIKVTEVTEQAKPALTRVRRLQNVGTVITQISRK